MSLRVTLAVACLGVVWGCSTRIVPCPPLPREQSLCACDGGLSGVLVCDPYDGSRSCRCDLSAEGGAFAFDNPGGEDGGAAGTAERFASVDSDSACASQTTEAKPGEKIDIIFLIDNSGSMDTEIAAVRSNINRNFAAVIGKSGVDYRVIMISEFGDGGQRVCVEPPLSGAPCSQGVAASLSTRFFHYDVSVQSNDPWCRLLDTFDQPDAEMLAPDGWSQWLREDARKLFVLVTDDSAGCTWEGPDGPVHFPLGSEEPVTDAANFHRALLARSPTHFGVPPDIRYAWYSIVGMPLNEPLSAPWFPHDPIADATCTTAATPGTAYQALSIMTDALRYPVCEGLGFEAVFRALSRGVIRTAKADCSFALPEPPDDAVLDTTSIAVEYRPSGTGTPTRIERVEDRPGCNGDGFFLDEDKIRLCPTSCAAIQADETATVEVLFGCGTDGPT